SRLRQRPAAVRLEAPRRTEIRQSCCRGVTAVGGRLAYTGGQPRDSLRIIMTANRHGLPISRRQFVQGVGVAGLGLLAGCGRLPWQAQPPPRMPRIGFLAPGSWQGRAPLIDGLLAGLRELGYVDGQNITIDYRFSEGDDERLPALAAELVARNVDVIVA